MNKIEARDAGRQHRAAQGPEHTVYFQLIGGITENGPPARAVAMQCVKGKDCFRAEISN